MRPAECGSFADPAFFPRRPTPPFGHPPSKSLTTELLRRMTDPTARPMRCAVYPPEMRIVVAIHEWGSGAPALTEPLVQRLGTKDTKLHCRSAIAAAQ